VILIQSREMKAGFILVSILSVWLFFGCDFTVCAAEKAKTAVTALAVPPAVSESHMDAGRANALPVIQSAPEGKTAVPAMAKKAYIQQRTEIGVFKITAYCPCENCNGCWAGQPAKNGEEMEEGLTIAVDPDVIPLGSYVYIEGVGMRKAQDTGSAIRGNKIDLFFSSHGETEEWGVRYLEVYWVN
jgi:3D (Asp-Asp-Asp) domain-containing protein